MVSAPDNILIFDRALRRQKHARSFSGDHAFLIDWANENIQDRLSDIKRELPDRLNLDVPDNEILNVNEEQFDLITSTLELHSVNDLPGVLIQIRRALKPDGLFLGALFGGETLYELRESLIHAEAQTKGGASARVFPFADKQQMGALLQRAGYALPVIDSEILTVTYDNIFKLMHDLRGMGESNIIRDRHKTNPGKAFFMEAANYYAKNFTEPDGKIRASFEIIFLIGWAPHESQQKPLRPGSAQNRLADALETKEVKTDEKALP